jgi:DNA-binding transcriptional LysR family regulator
MTALTVVFDARLPHARWGPLFHVFCLEQPDITLDWRPVGFPQSDRPLLDGADVGLFVQPPDDEGLCALVLDASPMVVVMAVGHPLAAHHELTVADVLDEPFPGGSSLRREWSAFWTLDEQRGAPPKRTVDDVRTAEDGLEVVASGRYRHRARMGGKRLVSSGRGGATAQRRAASGDAPGVERR